MNATKKSANKRNLNGAGAPKRQPPEVNLSEGISSHGAAPEWSRSDAAPSFELPPPIIDPSHSNFGVSGDPDDDKFEDIETEKEPEPEPQPVKPKGKIVIRIARPVDATPLYRCLIRYFEEMDDLYPEPLEAPTMMWGISVVNAGLCIVAQNEEGEIIGSIGLRRECFPFNPSVHCFVTSWFYVVPERRSGSNLGRTLLATAKQIAAKNKVRLMINEVWGYEPEAMQRFMVQEKFHHVGGAFVWRPDQME